MVDIMKIANSWWMYLLGAIVVVFVLLGSSFFFVKAYKEAKKTNMDKKVLKKVIFDSAIFTILPSISILLGVIALSGVVGIPLPWIRLSVIGALHYETVAVKNTLEALNSSIMTPQAFVTIAFVMTLGILTGPLFCLFGFKAYDKKVLAKAKANEDKPKDETNETEDTVEDNITAQKKQKKNLGAILFDAVFIAMVSAFIAVEVVKIFDTKKIGQLDKEGNIIEPVDTFIPLIVVLVSFGCMFLFDVLEKKCKQKWLGSFNMGLSMIVGMASAILANYLYTLG